MPLMAIYRADISPEAYDTFRAKVPLESAPKGALAHAYARDAEGRMLCVEIWEDAEAFAAFGRTVVAPNVAALGASAIEPEVVELRTLAVMPDIAGYELARREPEPA
jgi:quinol monooxygenase YgiN